MHLYSCYCKFIYSQAEYAKLFNATTVLKLVKPSNVCCPIEQKNNIYDTSSIL